MDSKKELFERNMEKMRENEEELKAIFDSVRDGIALIDTTGKIIRVNKRILEIGDTLRKKSLESDSMF